MSLKTFSRPRGHVARCVPKAYEPMPYIASTLGGNQAIRLDKMSGAKETNVFELDVQSLPGMETDAIQGKNEWTNYFMWAVYSFTSPDSHTVRFRRNTLVNSGVDGRKRTKVRLGFKYADVNGKLVDTGGFNNTNNEYFVVFAFGSPNNNTTYDGKYVHQKLFGCKLYNMSGGHASGHVVSTIGDYVPVKKVSTGELMLYNVTTKAEFPSFKFSAASGRTTQPFTL